MIFKCLFCQGGFTYAGVCMSHTGTDEEVWQPCAKCGGRGRVWILPLNVIMYRARQRWIAFRYPSIEEEEIPF